MKEKRGGGKERGCKIDTALQKRFPRFFRKLKLGDSVGPRPSGVIAAQHFGIWPLRGVYWSQGSSAGLLFDEGEIERERGRDRGEQSWFVNATYCGMEKRKRETSEERKRWIKRIGLGIRGNRGRSGRVYNRDSHSQWLRRFKLANAPSVSTFAGVDWSAFKLNAVQEQEKTMRYRVEGGKMRSHSRLIRGRYFRFFFIFFSLPLLH